jgi:hypothetical protein
MHVSGNGGDFDKMDNQIVRQISKATGVAGEKQAYEGVSM